MAQQTGSGRSWGGTARREEKTLSAVPDVTVRLGGALLALAVATAHVADQGGVAAFTSPDWLGWAYRLIEVGGVLTALTLVWPRSARLGWAAGILLGAAPFLGYVTSRTVGVPGDSGDVGNWADWVGTVALIVEAGLLSLSLGMLWAHVRRPSTTAVPETYDPAVISAGLPHGWDQV